MKKTLTALLMATALAACGGGGGGGGGGSGTPLTIDVPDPIPHIDGGISSTSEEGIEISDISKSALEARDNDDNPNASLLYACQGACDGDKETIIQRLPHFNILDRRSVPSALRVNKENDPFNEYFFRGSGSISNQNFEFENFGVWMRHSVFGELALFDAGTLPNATILYSFGDISKTNPGGPGSTGRMEWSGVSHVIRKAGEVQEEIPSDIYYVGTVLVDIDDLNEPDVDVLIENITPRDSEGNLENLEDLTWENISFLLNDGIGFRDQAGGIFGTFYGPEHQEVGGVFNRNGIEGVFGAIKEE